MMEATATAMIFLRHFFARTNSAVRKQAQTSRHLPPLCWCGGLWAPPQLLSIELSIPSSVHLFKPSCIASSNYRGQLFLLIEMFLLHSLSLSLPFFVVGWLWNAPLCSPRHAADWVRPSSFEARVSMMECSSQSGFSRQSFISVCILLLLELAAGTK